MKRWILLASIPVVAIGAVALNTQARQQPPTTAPTWTDAFGADGPTSRSHERSHQDRDNAGERGPRGGGGGGPFGDGPGGRGGPGFPGGPGGPDGGGGRMDPRRAPSMDTQRGYMELVNRYTELSRDSTSSGVAAVLTAADLLRPRGSDAAIDYFLKLQPSVKDPAIDRAIRLQLVELYRASNRADEALKQLEGLITADAQAK